MVSAALLAFLSAKLTPSDDRAERGTLAMIRDGLGSVLREPTLARMTLYLSLLNLVLTASVFAIVANFQAHGKPFSVGIALAAQAVAGLLGSLVAERLHWKLSAAALVCAHGGLWLAGLTAIGIMPTTPVGAVGLGLGWLVAPALRLAFAGRLVSAVAPDMRARANSAVSLSTSSFSLLGPPIAAVLAGVVGFGGTVVGLGLMALAALLLTGPAIAR